MYTIKAELKAARRDLNGYVVYVFKNLDTDDFSNSYKSVVKFPNWESPLLSIGDIGYLKFKEVIAGEDTWFNKQTNTKVLYNYDNAIFIDFVKETKVDKTILL